MDSQINPKQNARSLANNVTIPALLLLILLNIISLKPEPIVEFNPLDGFAKTNGSYKFWCKSGTTKEFKTQLASEMPIINGSTVAYKSTKGGHTVVLTNVTCKFYIHQITIEEK